MCGIVGIFLKNQSFNPKLGVYLADMLEEMTDRGPDSAGFAVYSEVVGNGQRLSLRLPLDMSAETVLGTLAPQVAVSVEAGPDSGQLVLRIEGDMDAARALLAAHMPAVTVLGWGRAIALYKAVGLPRVVSERYGLRHMAGTHGIGHTRMATESAVTTDGSHPFSTGADVCLVHNGSLSNHNRLRDRLRKRGIRFATQNDTEVAAGYLAWRLAEGDNLDTALRRGLDDLDGFYTLAVGTRDGFAVMRDSFACKPAVLAETEDWVAMASEYRAIARLPRAETAQVWEPEPARVYAWSHAA